MFTKLFVKKDEINFRDLLAQGAVIVDVRSPIEFTQGHIQKAVNIPLDNLLSGIEKVGGKDTCIITCCASGGRSMLAKNMLENAGFTAIYNGGRWEKLNYKIK
jgi:rhodanese-related sulfurtransferase